MANYKKSEYIPSFLKSAAEGRKSVSLTFSDISGSNIQNDQSFAYDALGTGLKSTQQLNVDWSKFENHTFFMSAEAKVNLTFEQIINGYPFDGTRHDVENFFSSLTGFDKWVFDRFPKFRGQLHFSGTQLSETTPNLGTYIQVKDLPGALFPALKDVESKSSILNPKNRKSLSIEMQLNVPEISTDGTQIILQKINDDDNHGFSVRLNPTMSTSTVEAQFDVFSGSYYMSVSKDIEKGKFNHLCFILDKDSSLYNLKIFNDEKLEAQSSTNVKIDDLNIDYADLLIGSGSQYNCGGTVTPQQTFSGSIDELRIFHSVRTQQLQSSYAKKSIHSTPDLKLYYKFNEPPPPLSSDSLTNSIILDSSGNALHSYVQNFGEGLRQDAAADESSNLIYEKELFSPVLFASNQDVIALNLELLTSASSYDLENPNLITRLIPRHYLLEGAVLEGFNSAEENNGSQYGGTGIPGQGELSNVQVMLSMLYIWAKFFDEIKLFLDSFNTLKTIDYDKNKSIPNNLLLDLAKSYGLFLPPLFTSATIEQYVLAENIDPLTKGNESLSLQSVQHELLRRVLLNLPSVIRSKGTQHSIKAFLRSLGIEPDSSVRFREYGGATYKNIHNAREIKSDLATMTKFEPTSLVISPFLSGSRTEIGFPEIQGTFVKKDLYPLHGISNWKDDGLFTSGSWAFECNYRYNPSIDALTSLTQSLARLCVTGSSLPVPELITNLVVFYDENSPKVTLFAKPSFLSTDPLLEMSLMLPKESIFNGDIWNISFGRQRSDSINSEISSSYFLRAATQNEGDITYFSTSSYFLEKNNISLIRNTFNEIIPAYNSSGSFLCLGNNQSIPAGPTNRYLNNTSFVVNDAARATAFDGRAAKMRFWSKALTEKEWIEHVKNYQSLGVDDPKTNYNYEKIVTGSFERLRLDCMTKQSVLRADGSGLITFLDFSENNNHLQGSGFPTDKNCILPEVIRYTHLSPYFDEAITNKKIRIRGYNDEKLISENPWSSPAPVHEIVKSESPIDDVRFSIDFSLVDALNKDIITMFSTFESLENYIGSPELVFSPDYPDLEIVRNVYFNRLKSKLNFKAFFEFYSWFDNSISTFIQQLLPRKTVFKGSNFIIESHFLERHKHEYYYNQAYTSRRNIGLIENK